VSALDGNELYNIMKASRSLATSTEYFVEELLSKKKDKMIEIKLGATDIRMDLIIDLGTRCSTKPDCNDTLNLVTFIPSNLHIV